MQSVVRLLSVSAASAVLLAGCGGGVSFFVGEDDWPGWEPFFSGRTSNLRINGTDDRLDGAWTSRNTEMTPVFRFVATTQNPETCRFQFYGLRQQGEGRFLDGEVRYVADTGLPRTVFIGIGPRVYRLGPQGWGFDAVRDRVVFTGAVARSLDVAGETITLDGSVPLPPDRPGGC